MATSFNKRLFGTDLDPEIKNKLRARQILAKHSVIPNHSSDFIEIDGQEYKISDLIGDVNFGGKNDFLSLGEMSSRTPFARMWTAVELYFSQPDIYDDNYGQVSWTLDSWGGNGGIHNKSTNEWKKNINKRKIQDAKNLHLEKKVYVVNNHHLNTFENNNANPNESIMFGEDGSIHQQGTFFTRMFADAKAASIFPNEGADNRFLKPPAGITNISSKTEGTLGAIKRTTVNFKVWNFNDFDTIYSRYFLRPGALIFIDIGWDTAQLYSPQELVQNHIHGAETIHDFIYGNVEKKKKGVVEKSKGDLDVLVGRVVSWDAKALRDGGWDCSIEVVSENEALLDHEVSEQNKMKNKFVRGLAPLVINEAARLIGHNFLRTDWMSSPMDLEESTAYAMKFASGVFGSQQSNKVHIDIDSRKTGVYFQRTFLASEADELNKTSGTDEEGDIEEGYIGRGITIDPNLHEIQNIYVSWGFFEDEILNKTLSLGFNENFEIAGKFDSTQSFVSVNSNLKQRQNLNGYSVRDKRSLKWLYPPTAMAGYHSYNTIHGRVPDYTDYENNPAYKGYLFSKIDAKLERVPLREVFVNLKIIQDAFEGSNSVNDAIKTILSEMNSFSYDIWDLKLTSLSRDNSILTIVDRNQIEPEKRTPDFYDSLFQFKPHDPETIIKDFDMNFTTPKNGLANMIAIGNTGYDNPLYPLTPDEELNNAIRNVMREGNQLGTRSFPVINEDQYLQNQDLFGAGDDFGDNIKDLLGGAPEAEALKQAYQPINTSVSEWMENDPIQESYRGLDDNEHNFDDIWGGRYAKNSLAVARGEEEPDIPQYEDDPSYSELGALVTSDLEEFFGYSAKTQYLHEGLSSILPIELSLSLYGISGIAPGDLFKVDWMPKRYREIVYFQVTGVSQEISGNTWTTKLETVMRIRLDKKDSNLYLKPRQILLSPNFFINMGMPAGFTNAFSNIVPTQWNDKFIGCTARGSRTAGGGPNPKMKVYLNSVNDDTYQQWEEGTVTQLFIQNFIDFATEYKPGGKATLAKIYGWQQLDALMGGTVSLDIQTGDFYYLVICFQGVIVFDITNANKSYGQQTISNEAIYNLVKDRWTKINEEWKDDYLTGKYQYTGGGYMTPQ